MGYIEESKKWRASHALDSELRAELESITDRAELKARFFAPLEFGTAGLRGVMGVGTRYMNIHTVRHATQGLANLIIREGKEACERGVVIGYDCRNNSRRFAEETAAVLAKNGIQVHLFDAMRPTPEVSFAIRRLRAVAGINITASHNKKEYNGYKVYWEDGAQLPAAHADLVAREIAATDLFEGVKFGDFEQLQNDGLIRMIPPEIDEEFMQNVLSVAINPAEIGRASAMRIVFTPFHGTGYKPVPEALSRLGFANVLCEPEQMKPDGNFPTVVSPNPENPEGFYLAVELAKKHGAQLIIGTDPDADRVGVVARNRAGEYRILTGNQTGALLFDYIIRARAATGKMPDKPMAAMSIVSTKMVEKIGNVNKIPVYSTFTGFKNIAEKVNEKQSEGYACIFSFEESYGYMIGDFVRDKDAIGASCLIAEMAAYYFNRNMTLFDALEDAYLRYGYYADRNISVEMDGLAGIKRIRELMAGMRKNPPEKLAGHTVLRMTDYKTGTVRENGKRKRAPLSGSNVLEFELKNAVFIIRPSGTEPKIKVYLMVSGSKKNADRLADKLEKFARDYLK